MKTRIRFISLFVSAALMELTGVAGVSFAQSTSKTEAHANVAANPIGQNSPSLFGSWKLVSLVYEFQDGRPSVPLLGEHPIGYLMLAPSGRMAAVLEGEGRKPAKTDEERSALLKTLISYSGKYRIEGDKWITKVDASWNGAWNGTEQVRNYQLDGDKLFVTSMWQPNSTMAGNPVAHAIMEWAREK